MSKKRFTPEEIIGKLRHADVLLGQGKKLAAIGKALGVSDVTDSRWRQEFGGMSTTQAKRLKELERENGQLRQIIADLTLDKRILQEAATGNLLSPSRRRACVAAVCEGLGVSERRACRVLGQHRATQRHTPTPRPDEAPLIAAILDLATQDGRYGSRRITALLRQAGWTVNAKRVERLWRLEGLKVPPRQPKRGRLWLNDGSCVRLRPAHPNHVWAYDFMTDRTHDGKAFRLLTVLDEYTRECLAIVVARRLTADDVLATLTDLFITRRCPDYLRSDNGPELCAKTVRGWLHWLGVQTLFIEPGSPWANGDHESFNGKLRDELLDREVFFTLQEAQVLIERWRQHYNRIRPHSALGYRPPAPEARAWPVLALAPQSELELLAAGH
ncbi:MAG TPA: IS3 family transposase [Candidatus Methylomirabilis sp.]|nr:IS3 family transposase [Candidatus Methylomirabilis sp.]